MDRKKKFTQIKKLVLPSCLTGFMIYTSYTCFFNLWTEYKRWIVNRFNVQERLYESINSLNAALQAIVSTISLLFASVLVLIQRLRPQKSPLKALNFLTQHGFSLSLLFTALFSGSLIIDRININTIRNTKDICKVPAVRREYYRSMWLELVAELFFEGVLVSLIFGIRGNRKHSKDKP